MSCVEYTFHIVKPDLDYEVILWPSQAKERALKKNWKLESELETRNFVESFSESTWESRTCVSN